MEALKNIGFDHVFNYKTTDLGKALDQAAPDGIDVYWVRTKNCHVLHADRPFPQPSFPFFNGRHGRTTLGARRWTRCCPA